MIPAVVMKELVTKAAAEFAKKKAATEIAAKAAKKAVANKVAGKVLTDKELLKKAGVNNLKNIENVSKFREYTKAHKITVSDNLQKKMESTVKWNVNKNYKNPEMQSSPGVRALKKNGGEIDFTNKTTYAEKMKEIDRGLNSLSNSKTLTQKGFNDYVKTVEGKFDASGQAKPGVKLSDLYDNLSTEEQNEFWNIYKRIEGSPEFSAMKANNLGSEEIQSMVLSSMYGVNINSSSSDKSQAGRRKSGHLGYRAVLNRISKQIDEMDKQRLQKGVTFSMIGDII